MKEVEERVCVCSYASRTKQKRIDNLQSQGEKERQSERASEREKCVCEIHEVIDDGEFYSLDAIIFLCTIVMLSLSLCHCFWYCYCYYRYRHGCSTAFPPSPCFLMQWLYFVIQRAHFTYNFFFAPDCCHFFVFVFVQLEQSYAFCKNTSMETYTHTIALSVVDFHSMCYTMPFRPIPSISRYIRYVCLCCEQWKP